MANTRVDDNYLLSVVRTFIANHGYAPSVRELGTLLEVRSSATIWNALNRLRSKGHLDWQPGLARSIVLTDELKTSGVYSFDAQKVMNPERVAVVDEMTAEMTAREDDAVEEFRQVVWELRTQLPTEVWLDLEAKSHAVLDLI